MTSVWLDSTHRVDALMCTRSVGLHDAPYAKVLSHLRFLTISTHNDQGNWAGLNTVTDTWIDISHGPPNRASADVYRNFHQRCACAGSSIPIQNSPALHALAVNDPSSRQDLILWKGNQHARPKLPRPSRGDACAVRVHVLGERPFLNYGCVWVRKLSGQFLRDTPFGSTVGPTGLNWRTH